MIIVYYVQHYTTVRVLSTAGKLIPQTQYLPPKTNEILEKKIIEKYKSMHQNRLFESTLVVLSVRRTVTH